jgi:hypothetical protein
LRGGWPLLSYPSRYPPATARTAHRGHHRRPLTLREQVIAPILASVRSPRRGRKPITWTNVDRDYERIRIDMQTLFKDLGIRVAE